MELEDYEVGRALNLWYFCTTEIIVYLFINLEQQITCCMSQDSMVWAVFPCMSWPVGTPQERTGLDPIDMMVLPCEWAPSMACNSEKGEEDKDSFLFPNLMTPHSAHYTYIPYISIVSNYCPRSNFSQIHQWLSAQASTQKWELLQGGHRQYMVLI